MSLQKLNQRFRQFIAPMRTDLGVWNVVGVGIVGEVTIVVLDPFVPKHEAIEARYEKDLDRRLPPEIWRQSRQHSEKSPSVAFMCWPVEGRFGTAEVRTIGQGKVRRALVAVAAIAIPVVKARRTVWQQHLPNVVASFEKPFASVARKLARKEAIALPGGRPARGFAVAA